MTPYTYYEYYAWYMRPDGGFDSNNRVGYLSYGIIMVGFWIEIIIFRPKNYWWLRSPVTDFFDSNFNFCAWYVTPSGDASFDNRSDGVARSYGRILSGHCYKSRCSYRYNDRETLVMLVIHLFTHIPTVSYLNTSKRSILLEA